MTEDEVELRLKDLEEYTSKSIEDKIKLEKRVEALESAVSDAKIDESWIEHYWKELDGRVKVVEDAMSAGDKRSMAAIEQALSGLEAIATFVKDMLKQIDALEKWQNRAEDKSVEMNLGQRVSDLEDEVEALGDYTLSFARLLRKEHRMTDRKKPIWRKNPAYAREKFWEGYREAEAEIRAEREAERQDRDPGRDHPDAP